MAENEVPFETDGNVTYYYPPIIGRNIRDYSRIMTFEKRKELFRKTSERLAALNDMFAEGQGVFEKIGYAGEVCDWQQLVSKVMEKYAMAIENNNLVEAERIYNSEFMRLKHCDIKGAFSVGEIQKNLDNKNKFLKFYKKFKAAAAIAGEIGDKVNKVKKGIEYYKRIKDLVSSETRCSAELSEARKCRTEFMEAKGKMNTLVDICSDLTDMAPMGMKEYIQFNLAVFKASDQAMKIINKHCDRIESLLADIEKQFQENNRSNHTVKDGSNFVNDRNNKGMDQYISGNRKDW